MALHPKLTIKLTAYRQDLHYLSRLERYAIKRYEWAWANRHLALADMFFAASDRCRRIERLLEDDVIAAR